MIRGSYSSVVPCDGGSVLSLSVGKSSGKGIETWPFNAQLLVGARQADLTQVDRVLAQGAAPNTVTTPVTPMATPTTMAMTITRR